MVDCRARQRHNRGGRLCRKDLRRRQSIGCCPHWRDDATNERRRIFCGSRRSRHSARGNSLCRRCKNRDGRHIRLARGGGRVDDLQRPCSYSEVIGSAACRSSRSRDPAEQRVLALLGARIGGRSREGQPSDSGCSCYEERAQWAERRPGRRTAVHARHPPVREQFDDPLQTMPRGKPESRALTLFVYRI